MKKFEPGGAVNLWNKTLKRRPNLIDEERLSPEDRKY